MSSSKSVARTYLAWFEQSAPRDAVLLFNAGADYPVRYSTPEGGVVNAITFVTDLAYARLSEFMVGCVVEEAKKLVSPDIN